jgi:protein gp37
MAESNIEWTNISWNPTTGCTHYSSLKNGGNECLNCYAETLTKRLKAMGQERYKMGFDVVVIRTKDTVQLQHLYQDVYL